MTAKKNAQSTPKVGGGSPEDATAKELKKMKQEILALQKELSDKSNDSNVGVDDFDIRPDKTISVMSMLPWTLVLRSDRSKKSYVFNRQFQIKRIPFGDLRDILDDNITFAENGYFQVLNKDVVRAYGLDEAYENALDREGFERIFGTDVKTSISLLESINKKQVDVIANILISKLKSGEDVDMNLVYATASKSGIDIVEKAETAKALMEIQ
jgi:hypothetical protein